MKRADLKRPESLNLAIDAQGVARLALNRPEIRNAFDDVLIHDITVTLERLAFDKSVRAVVLTGVGKAFSAGAQIDWMRAAGAQDEHANFLDAMRLATMLKTLDQMPMPTVARVNGAALGGGVGLTVCCDIAIAVEAAVFGFSEVKLGIIPGAIGPYAVRAIGARNARRYFLTGERFDAATAERLGLVHQVVPAAAGEAGLDAAVDAVLAEILGSGPGAVRASKALVIEVAGKNIDDTVMRDTAQRIARQRAGREAVEGLSAFLEKRQPDWNC